jgi:hypothetical protein
LARSRAPQRIHRDWEPRYQGCSGICPNGWESSPTEGVDLRLRAVEVFRANCADPMNLQVQKGARYLDSVRALVIWIPIVPPVLRRSRGGAY